MKEIKEYSALAHVPRCATWPPKWISDLPGNQPRGPIEPTPAPNPAPAPAPAPMPMPMPAPAPTPETQPAPAKLPPGFPADAVIVVADERSYCDENMKGPPFMWCWIGGPTWFYVSEFPVPGFRP